MDPFSGEGELLNLSTAFLRGSYTQVLDFDASSLSASNTLAARILKLRAKIALGDQASVLEEIKSETGPDYAALKAFTLYTQGKTDQAVKQTEKLVENESGNGTVQLLGGTVLQGVGRTEDALALLAKHEGSLEAVALTVQIHLTQNRTDLALKECQAARKWAQDSLLVNIAESWVGLRIGGERYQSAYYVFEEMASTPGATGTQALVQQAISELHLNRTDEAKAALDQALEKDAENVPALANAVVLNIVAGKAKEAAELQKKLKGLDDSHPMLEELRAKGKLFDEASKKYSAKVAS